MTTEQYQIWVRLNFAGKQEWGEVFPEGKVPIVRFAVQQAKLEGIKDIESVFTVNWKELTQKQQQAILERLSMQTGVSKEKILKEVARLGLPLRRKWVQSIGTNQIELFSKGPFTVDMTKQES